MAVVFRKGFKMKRFSIAVLLAVVCATGSVRADNSSIAAELNKQGIELYNAGKYQSAGRVFERALRLVPHNKIVQENSVNCYLQLADERTAVGDYSGAIDQVGRALEVQPKNAGLYVRSASYAVKTKNINTAEFNLRAALDLEPDNVNAHMLLGEVLYDTGNLQGAIAEWEIVLKAKPERKDVMARLEKARREIEIEGNHSVRESRRFVLAYERSELRSEAGRVLRMLDRLWYRVGRDLKYFPEAGVQIPVVLYTPDKFFTATGAGMHIAGLYDGKIRVPIDPKTKDDDTLNMLLKHEYTHVVIRLKTNDNVPFWLNEGLAQFESESFSARHRQHIEKALASGTLVPLEKLDATHVSLKGSDPSLIYAESFAAVRHIHKKYGMRKLLALLDRLGEKYSTEEALGLALRRGFTYKRLHDETFRSFTPAR